MGVLDAAHALPDPLSSAENSRKVVAGLTTALGVYPYIDSIAWIDRNGSQKARFDTRKRTPLGEVAERQYFRDALINRTWTVSETPYVLEWVRSRSTGEVRAVLAKNTGNPRYPVMAMSTDLIDLTHAVRPAGVELAI